jgi:hypothetical protein
VNSTDNRLRLVWKAGKFPLQAWSVYERVLNQDPRTNDFLEGWHRRFGSIVGVAHPDVYKFIASLKSEQAWSEMVRRSAIMGEACDAIKKK